MQAKLLDITNTIADNYVHRLSYEIDEITNNVKFLSTNKIITDATFTAHDKLDLLKNFVKSNTKKYYSMAIYDIQGNNLIDTDLQGKHKNVFDKLFFKNSLNGKSYFDKKPELINNNHLFHYSVPLFDLQKHVLGVLDTRIPVSLLDDIINKNNFYFGQNRNISIFNFLIHVITNDGVEVYSNEVNYLKNDLDYGLNNGDVINKTLLENNKPLFFKNHVFISVSEPNVNPLYFSNGKWKFIFQGDLSFLTNEYGRIVYEFIILSVIILLLSIFIIYLFVKKIISPISKLKDIALNIGHGKFNNKITIDGSDEIKDLSISLESMRRNILKFNNNLKDLVSERTRELEYTNSKLKIKEMQLRTINDELNNSNKTKEEFLSMMSHELKTPITPMKLYIEMMLNKNQKNNLNDFQKKALDILYKNIVKLELIINDMFSVYKLELGNFKINKEVIHIGKLIENNVTELKPIMKDKNIYFNYMVTRDKCVLCDPVRISQVLHNLVSNAVDHVPEQGGRILIKVEEMINSVDVHSNNKTRKLIVSIEDNGIGIPADKIKDLFKKFYQIDTGVKRKHGGTGLGLAICKGIMEAHGEKIWLDEKYFNGTCFKFSLSEP